MNWSSVHIGSNVITGPATPHTVFTAGGSRLFSTRLRDDGQLLLSADLYVQRGRHVGYFTHHIWRTAHSAALLVAPKRVAVRYHETVLLSVWHRDNELIVTALDLETRDGKRCELDSYGRFALSTPGAQLPERQSNLAINTNLNHIDLATLATTNQSTAHSQ